MNIGEIYTLKKDLPDLDAGAKAVVSEEDSNKRQFMYIASGTPNARDGWFFYIDEIKHFDEWFEKA